MTFGHRHHPPSCSYFCYVGKIAPGGSRFWGVQESGTGCLSWLFCPWNFIGFFVPRCLEPLQTTLPYVVSPIIGGFWRGDVYGVRNRWNKCPFLGFFWRFQTPVKRVDSLIPTVKSNRLAHLGFFGFCSEPKTHSSSRYRPKNMRGRHICTSCVPGSVLGVSGRTFANVIFGLVRVFRRTIMIFLVRDFSLSLMNHCSIEIF